MLLKLHSTNLLVFILYIFHLGTATIEYSEATIEYVTTSVQFYFSSPQLLTTLVRNFLWYVLTNMYYIVYVKSMCIANCSLVPHLLQIWRVLTESYCIKLLQKK